MPSTRVIEGLIEAEEVGPLVLKGLLKAVPTVKVLGLKRGR